MPLVIGESAVAEAGGAGGRGLRQEQVQAEGQSDYHQGRSSHDLILRIKVAELLPHLDGRRAREDTRHEEEPAQGEIAPWPACPYSSGRPTPRSRPTARRGGDEKQVERPERQAHSTFRWSHSLIVGMAEQHQEEDHRQEQHPVDQLALVKRCMKTPATSEPLKQRDHQGDDPIASRPACAGSDCHREDRQDHEGPENPDVRPGLLAGSSRRRRASSSSFVSS